MNKIAQKRRRTKRRADIVRAIELLYASLHSHLRDSVKAVKPVHTGNEEFQAGCVCEYADIIHTLSVELHELTKLDFKSTHEGR